MRKDRIWLGLMLVALVGCQKKPAADVSEVVEQGTVSQRDPAQDLSRAADLLASGEPALIAESIELFEELVETYPDNLELLEALGAAQFNTSQYERALSSFSKLARKSPETTEYVVLAARAEMALGEESMAVRRLEKSLESHPEDIELHRFFVASLRRAGDYQGCIEAAKTAMIIDSRDFQIAHEMAQAYLSLGEQDMSAFIYEKTSTRPGAEDSAVIQANLAWSYYLAGDAKEAEARLEEVVERFPDDVPSLVRLAEIKLSRRAYASAEPLLEAAVKGAAEDPHIHLLLGIAQRGTGNLDAAEASYRKVLVLDPELIEAHFNLGILLGDYRKDYAQAQEELSAYISGGGASKELAGEYIAALSAEEAREKKRAAAAEARRKRQEKAEANRRLLEEEEARKAAEAAQEAETSESVPPDSSPDGSPQGEDSSTGGE